VTPSFSARCFLTPPQDHIHGMRSSDGHTWRSTRVRSWGASPTSNADPMDISLSETRASSSWVPLTRDRAAIFVRHGSEVPVGDPDGRHFKVFHPRDWPSSQYDLFCRMAANIYAACTSHRLGLLNTGSRRAWRMQWHKV